MGRGGCFAACVQRGGSEFRRQVCVCVAEQWTSRDRAQLGRVGCVCVGGGFSLCFECGIAGEGCREYFAECSAQRVRVLERGVKGVAGGGSDQLAVSVSLRAQLQSSQWVDVFPMYPWGV